MKFFSWHLSVLYAPPSGSNGEVRLASTQYNAAAAKLSPSPALEQIATYSDILLWVLIIWYYMIMTELCEHCLKLLNSLCSELY